MSFNTFNSYDTKAQFGQFDQGEAMLRQLRHIKWVLVSLISITSGLVVAVVVSAMVFRTKVTELNPSATNQFLSDVYTMAANGRSASQDVPTLVHSASVMAQIASSTMQSSESTPYSDLAKSMSEIMTEENFMLIMEGVASMPWEEKIFPLVSRTLDNADNMEKILMIVMSALQNYEQPPSSSSS